MLSILLLACALGDEPAVTGSLTTAFRERARQFPGLKNDDACKCLHEEPPKVDDLLISPSGGVKNAFVWVSQGVEPKDRPVPAEAVVLDQKGCVYSPRVVAVRVGQPLEFRSQDNMLHNVHGLTFENKEFNLVLLKGQTAQRTFPKPEVFRVKCDVHPWMWAVIGVFENPYYALSDAEGRFTIKGLPPGKYELSVFHERLKTAAKTIPFAVEGASTSLPALELVEKK